MKSNALEYPSTVDRRVGPGGKGIGYPTHLIEGSVQLALRRGGRVAEGAALEMPYTGNCIAGSNPALSATVTPGPPRVGQGRPFSRGLARAKAGGLNKSWDDLQTT